ncbi:uncharacterized protein MELLADRAFT_103871 [Melampsora larici-populina 98AG31]|uniref:Uncharacterized protein n=1 Tax=Melampsora larici-populina (strain 98AG31 / pathotype 3-4-7) TaxID=747676 RepID=F4RCU3_MELLP|nr:uncharacterized protein MELLADRAFT_103871 [Melampsora larici-populina 98AG31]EGG09781.1 hypothetical protein MELLADRAFT_103871 [Melampsora larici-populina 98AG31]
MNMLPPAWALQARPTPSDKTDSLIEGKLWLNSGLYQENPALCPGLGTDQQNSPLHDVDWSQEMKNWCTDDLYSHGSATQQLTNSWFEEQLDVPVLPMTWPTYHQNENSYLGKRSGSHVASPMDTGTISSHDGSNYAFKDDPHGHQNLYKPTNLDGFEHHQTLSLGPESQVPPRMIGLQSGPLTSGLNQYQETNSHPMKNYEGVLPSTDMAQGTPSIEWDHLGYPSLNYLPPRVPHSGAGSNLSGLTSPRTYTPSSEIFQYTQCPLQDHITRQLDMDMEKLNRHRNTYTTTGSQAETSGKIYTTTAVLDSFKPVITQIESLKGKKRLSGKEGDTYMVTKGGHSAIDQNREIGSLETITHPRKKQTKKQEVRQSQGVLDISKPSPSMSVAQNFNLYVGTRKNQNPISTPDTPGSVSKGIKEAPEEESMKRRESMLMMLRDIGAFHVANSPALSYTFPTWFKILREDMIGISGQDEMLQKAVHQAIECADQWIAKAFFGLILLKYKPESTKISLEEMVQRGFQFMQTVFDQWRHMEIKSMKGQTGTTRTETSDHLDPSYMFRYFSKLIKARSMTLKVLDSIVVRWNRETKNIFVMPAVDRKKLYDEVKSLYDKDMMFIRGGLYSRAGFGNLEYEEINFQSGLRKHPLAPKSSERRKIEECRSLSKSARFLSPVGIEMCQKVHVFFVDLIIDLLKNYKISNQLDSYSTEQLHLPNNVAPKPIDENELIMETIVKAASIAEYRITVGFIGMIRLVYENRLKETQLNILIENGWEFLQKQFSKWKDLNFEEGGNLIFSKGSKLISWDERTGRLGIDPRNSFQALCIQSKSPANTPISMRYLTALLKSWFKDPSDSELKNSLGQLFKWKLCCSRFCLKFIQDVGKGNVVV